MKNKETKVSKIGILFDPKKLTFKRRVRHIWHMILGTPVVLIGDVITENKTSNKKK